MAKNTAALQVIDLSQKLGGRTVLRHVCFEIHSGEIVALTGANGAGKTTLLRCLACTLRPGSGEVRWLEQPAGRRQTVRRLVGFAAHESFLYPHLTAVENLVFAARMYGVPAPRPRALQLLENAGLLRVSHLPTGRLSQGMRKRLSILRALVHEPPILLLDEPFSSMDEDGRNWLCGCLRQLRLTGQCICFATHEVAAVECLAERVFQLKAGELHENKQRPRKAIPNRNSTSHAA